MTYKAPKLSNPQKWFEQAEVIRALCKYMSSPETLKSMHELADRLEAMGAEQKIDNQVQGSAPARKLGRREAERAKTQDAFEREQRLKRQANAEKTERLRKQRSAGAEEIIVAQGVRMQGPVKINGRDHAAQPHTNSRAAKE